MHACRDVGEFRKVARIGEGTYGLVYKAINKESGEAVALKRILLHHESKEGFPMTAFREINILQQYSSRHPNIVQLKEVCCGRGRDAVFLVFEYCEHDLRSLSSNFRAPFKESEVKRLICQLLSAVGYLHRNWCVHRDLKPSNLLYNSRGQLKVADFGLARALSFPSPKAITPGVTTLWYRAPEVLLGCEQYSFSVDMWAVGCIIGELLVSSPLLPGNDELDQIRLIFSLLGTCL
jgi:serine/threonine protein kinase